MSKNFSSAVCGFLIGIWFSSFWTWGWSVAALVLLFALIFFFRRFTVVAFFFLFFGFGVMRVEWYFANQPVSNLIAGQVATLTGVIAEEPLLGNVSNQLVLEIESGERVLVTTALFPEYNYGDKLTLVGKPERPKNFITDSGREFDYVNYLKRRGIQYQFYQPRITVVSSGEGNWLSGFLFMTKQKFLSGVGKVLPEPQAGLLSGLLIGGRRSVDKSLLDQFQRVGLSHMVVISGYNLTIVAEAVRWLFGFLPFYSSLGLAAGSVVLFSMMAGGGPVIWRATLMALIALLARATGKVYQATIALAFAVIALLVWDPTYLVFDFGFQLAVLATLGLIFLSPLVKLRLRQLEDFLVFWGLFPRNRENLAVVFREILATTIAAQIAVLPWILYQTGNLSIVALVVNPIVLVVVPVIMLLGFITGLVALVSTFVAFVPGSITYLLLSYQLTVVSFFSRLSFASVTISSFPLPLVLILYGLIIWWYCKSRVGVSVS